MHSEERLSIIYLLGNQNSISNVLEIDISQFLSEDSLLNHRQTVENFVSNYLQGIKEPSFYEITNSLFHKSFSTEQPLQLNSGSSSAAQSAERDSDTLLPYGMFNLLSEALIEIHIKPFFTLILKLWLNYKIK